MLLANITMMMLAASIGLSSREVLGSLNDETAPQSLQVEPDNSSRKISRKRMRPSPYPANNTIQTRDFFVLKGYTVPSSPTVSDQEKSMKKAVRMFQQEYGYEMTDGELTDRVNSDVQKVIKETVLNYLRNFSYLRAEFPTFRDVRKALKNFQRSTGGELAVTGVVTFETFRFMVENPGGYGASDGLVSQK